MSRDRLLDLRNKIMLDGWDVTRQTEDGLKEDGSINNLLRFEHDSNITWTIVHSERALKLDLRFIFFGHFGERPNDLRDVSYCDAVDHGLRLFFSKIKTDRWRRELSEFVAKLGEIESPP